MQKKSFDLIYENETDGTAGGEIIAYASTFDRVPDSYGDVVARGAFTRTLQDWKASGNPIPLLFGHRTDDPRMNIGAVLEAEEDDRGLRIRAQFDDANEIAQYSRKLVKEGRLTKLSFAYDTIASESVMLDDGTKARELQELKLYEVSLVPIPANEMTEVISAKAAGDDADESVLMELSEKEKVADDSTDNDIMTLATIAERLDTIADMIDDITKRMAAMSDPKQHDDISAKQGNMADDTDDNGEAKCNPEVAEKSEAVLTRMAGYISID